MRSIARQHDNQIAELEARSTNLLLARSRQCPKCTMTGDSQTQSLAKVVDRLIGILHSKREPGRRGGPRVSPRALVAEWSPQAIS